MLCGWVQSKLATPVDKQLLSTFSVSTIELALAALEHIGFPASREVTLEAEALQQIHSLRLNLCPTNLQKKAACCK